MSNSIAYGSYYCYSNKPQQCPQKDLSAQEIIDVVKKVSTHKILSNLSIPNSRDEKHEAKKKRLKELLSGEKEKASILAASSKCEKPHPSSSSQKTKAKIYTYISDIFKSLAELFSMRKILILSKKYENLAKHQSLDDQALNKFQTHSNDLLGSSSNAIHPDIFDFCFEKDSSVTAFGGINIKNTEAFDHEKGLCYGMSMWFISLYLLTYDDFQDREKHLEAVTKIFEQGATKPCAILQTIQAQPNANDLLTEFLNLRIDIANQELETHDLHDDPKKTHDQIKGLKNGIYEISLYKHSIVFIKINDKKGYLFDANLGTPRRLGNDQAGDELATNVINYFEGFDNDPYWKKTDNGKIIIQAILQDKIQ